MIANCILKTVVLAGIISYAIAPAAAQTCIWSPNCSDPRDHQRIEEEYRRKEAETLQRRIDSERRDQQRQAPGPKVIQAPTATAPSSGIGADYQSLFRQPTAFVGRMVAFRGKVIQSLQSGVKYTLRVNVTPGPYNSWTDTMLVDYHDAGATRILEGDIVDFQGKFVGITSYTAVMGQTIQIPHVQACDIQSGTSGIRTVPRAAC